MPTPRRLKRDGGAAPARLVPGHKTAPGAAEKQARLRELVAQVRELEQELAERLRITDEKVHQLEELMLLSSLLNSSLDPAFVHEKALEATCRLVRCETASLLLVDSATGELYWDSALGAGGKELQRTLRLPINDRSIAGWVAMTGEGVLSNDVASDQRHFKKAPQSSFGFKTRNMICIPLKARDRVVGVLEAINKDPEFRGEDRQLLEALGHQVAVALENSSLYQNLKGSFYDTVEALAESIEKKDSYTGGHTKRVVHYSMCIAKYLQLAPEQLERIRLGALLHDVGKIGIEDKILRKAAPLDPAEWKEMQQHPSLGFDIMSRVRGLRDVTGGMRYHHERWDGKGYPLGLKGEEIPLMARIIAVADTYDAMVSTRPYRKGLEPRIAYEEIVRNSGTQFDPRVVAAFQEAYSKEKMGPGSGGSRYAAGD